MIASAAPAPNGPPAIQQAITRPPEGTIIARLVADGMPGEGVLKVATGPRIGDGVTWNSLGDAQAAARKLTVGFENPAVGIFRSKDSFEAFQLLVAPSGSLDFSPYEAVDSDSLARTLGGRSLVSIIDGDDTPTLMSAAAFRKLARYAGEE